MRRSLSLPMFVVGTIYKNRVYALEKQGYLIVTNRNFTKTDVV